MVAKGSLHFNGTHHLPVGSKAVRRTSENRWLELTLGVRRTQDLPDLAAYDKVLPEDRKYMTPAELTDNYGSDPAAIDNIKKFAAAHKLVVTKDERASARLGLVGTVANLSAAFGVTLFNPRTHPTLGDFLLPGRDRSNCRQRLQMTSRACSGSTTIASCGEFVRLCQPSRRPSMQLRRHDPGSSLRNLANVYNFPPANAATQCVGLLEFGGGVDDSDLKKYFQTLNLPVPSVKVIALDGVSTDPAADPDSTGEVMLDLDVVGSLAAGAKIAVYFSTFDEKGLIDALSAVINDTVNNPSVLSISWGWAENQDFNNQGITPGRLPPSIACQSQLFGGCPSGYHHMCIHGR